MSDNKIQELANKLYTAIEALDYETVDSLLKKYKHRRKYYARIGWLLRTAIKKMDVKMVKIFLKYDYYPFVSRTANSLAMGPIRSALVEISDAEDSEDEKIKAKGIKILRMLINDERSNDIINLILEEVLMFDLPDVALEILNRDDVNPTEDSLKLALFQGQEEVANRILEMNTVNPKSPSLVWAAAANGMVETIRLLLKDKRSKPGAYNSKALFEAVRHADGSKRYPQIIKMLIKDPRVNPAAKDNRALKIAIKRDHKEIVKILYGVKAVKSTLDKETLDKIKQL